MKTRKCSECNGTGEIKVESYREFAERPIEEKSVPAKAKWNWGKIKTRFTTGGWIITGLATIGLFIGMGVRSCQESVQSERDYVQWCSKMGYAVYSPYAHKCWIVGPRLGYDRSGRNNRVLGPNFPGIDHMGVSWIEVPDRDDADGFAALIGVEDASKCIR